MMEEEWKEIEGWETKYKINANGVVWNIQSNKEVAQVLTGIPQYKYVNLCTKGQKKLCRVHILVAKAFIPSVEGCNIVDHVDRDKMNNHVSNLRWVDHKGNQRNREDNFYFGDVLLKDFIKDYDNPVAAYSFFKSRVLKGLSSDYIEKEYTLFLENGHRLRKILWEGKEIYLVELCKIKNSDYDWVSYKLYKGWDIWNAIYDVQPEYKNSFEIKGETANHWYKSLDGFNRIHGRSQDLVLRLKDTHTLEQIINWDGKDYLRQTVCGFNGTVEELCNHFDKSYSSVVTKISKGVSLEDALNSPRIRVKRLGINGVFNSPKYWYESFGLNYKSVGALKSKRNFSFKETFEHFGVDTTDMIIELP